MKKIKHTPGPWKRNHLTVKDQRGMVVATASEPHRMLKGAERDEDMEWCRGNARLIAAAPDLLAVLIELTDIEGPLPGTREWHAKATAAIAKARGEA